MGAEEACILRVASLNRWRDSIDVLRATDSPLNPNFSRFHSSSLALFVSLTHTLSH